MKNRRSQPPPHSREGNGRPARPDDQIGDDRLIEAVQRRIEAHLGPIRAVWCLPRPDDRVHVDLHWVPPTPTRPWHTILTTGMAERPMHAPKGLEDCRFAEVYLCLPPDWPMAARMRIERPDGWPLRVLGKVAQYPHQNASWVWYPHTFAEHPLEPFAPGVGFSSVVLGPPISLPVEFPGIPVEPGRTVWHFSLLPLHASERAFALHRGARELLRRLAQAGVTDVVDPRRSSVVDGR